ncbi:MAG: glycosyltransferase family 2 protein [Sideroxyarcus sp.]
MAHQKQAGVQVNSPMLNTPLVSIIIAVLNGNATLQQCIDSIRQQTYPNKELIFIDGGSIDGTVDLLAANAENINYWISEPDRGIYNAWNKGLAQAHGEWICFLGADDFLWAPDVLERMVIHLQNLPQNTRVAYGQIMLIGEDGKSSRSIGEPWKQAKESFRQYMSIPHVGTMHRRALFEQNGIFDESFRIAGDYELLLRELKTGVAVFIPDIIIAGQRLGGVSTAANNNFKIKQEVWRAQRMHGLPLQWGAVFKETADEFLQLALKKVVGESSARKLLSLRKRNL